MTRQCKKTIHGGGTVYQRKDGREWEVFISSPLQHLSWDEAREWWLTQVSH